MMTMAESILDHSRGAIDARNAAMNIGALQSWFNGMEIYTFTTDNSTLIIINGVAVIAGKGI